MESVTGTRFLISLAATFAGWGAGFLAFIVSAELLYGEATDEKAMFFWPGLFILMGWALIFLPLLDRFPPGHRVFEPRVFPLVGAALGMAAFFVLVSWWTGLWRHAIYPLYAAVAGGVAAAIYAFANQALLGRAASEET